MKALLPRFPVSVGRLGKIPYGHVCWCQGVSHSDVIRVKITKTGVHPMQLASLLFCQSADCFFNSGGAKVTIGWIRSHAGLAGNEVVDALVKEAALLLLTASVISGSMVTYKHAQAKQLIDVHWQLAWHHWPSISTSAGTAVGGRLPLCKLKGNCQHNTTWPLGPVFQAPCRWGARSMQVMLGHGWFGTYRQRFGLLELMLCPCSDPPEGDESDVGADPLDPILQTLNHIMRECPHFEAAQTEHLYNHALQLIPSDTTLFGSQDSVRHFLAFLSATDVAGPICGSYRPQVSARGPPLGAKAFVG